MQWSKIKTLFILCFLILNIYLLIQFIDKQRESDYPILDSADESSIEDQLKADKIKYGDIKSEVTEATYISVLQRNFSDEELKQLAKMPNQKPAVVNSNFIVSLFNDPIEIPEKASAEDISKVVGSHTMFPEEYEYWGWNEEMNVLIFFQLKDKRPIYFNQNGLLLVYLNDKDEMVFYTQTMLGDAEPQGDLKTLNRPIQAIETLYNNHQLFYEDKISNVKIGYYARVLAEGVQVFAPTWRVSVNEDRNYFVNAIEGLVFPSDDIQFLLDTIEENLIKIRAVDGNNTIKKTILAHLEKKLEESESNRSEVK